MSLAKVSRPAENGQGNRVVPNGGEKENLIPPLWLVGSISTALKLKKSKRTLADAKLEVKVISQCGSLGLDDCKPSRTNMTGRKLEGQIDVVEYCRIEKPDLVHMGDPGGGYVEMIKAKNSARGHLMSSSLKKAMQEHSQELMEGSNLRRK